MWVLILLRQRKNSHIHPNENSPSMWFWRPQIWTQKRQETSNHIGVLVDKACLQPLTVKKFGRIRRLFLRTTCAKTIFDLKGLLLQNASQPRERKPIIFCLRNCCLCAVHQSKRLRLLVANSFVSDGATLSSVRVFTVVHAWIHFTANSTLMHLLLYMLGMKSFSLRLHSSNDMEEFSFDKRMNFSLAYQFFGTFIRRILFRSASTRSPQSACVFLLRQSISLERSRFCFFLKRADFFCSNARLDSHSGPCVCSRESIFIMDLC